MNPQPKTLGRGLNALFQESLSVPSAVPEGNLTTLKTFRLKPSPFQPRQRFDAEHLESLVNSIREKGIIQPIIVRPTAGEDIYEIIAGERRWRAAKTLNLEEVPVIIRSCSDNEALEFALIENIQRNNLDPLEEAEGFQRLLLEFNYTQEQLAKVIGKSRSHIANTIRLLQLPEAIKKLVSEGKITAGHARALLTHPHPESMVDQILQDGMNVRDVERHSQKTTPSLLIVNETKEQEAQLAQHLSDLLGLQTTLKITKKGGSITIHFQTFEQMDGLMDRLRQLKTLN